MGAYSTCARAGAWGVLRWLTGLHSPTVMYAYDVLMLVVAFTLGLACLIFSLPPSAGTPLKPVT